MYIFCLIPLVTNRQGYPNRAHKAYFAITLFLSTINIIYVTLFCSSVGKKETEICATQQITMLSPCL